MSQQIKDFRGQLIDKDKAVMLSQNNRRRKPIYGHIEDKEVTVDCMDKSKYLYKLDTNTRKIFIGVQNSMLPIFGYTDRRNLTKKELIEVHLNGSAYHSLVSAISSDFVESMKNGVFYYKEEPFNVRQKKYSRFGHPEISSKLDMFKFGMISPTNLIAEGKRYTFGIELETSKGFVPKRLRSELNIDCQYDGSIVDDKGQKDCGGEYTTGVLYGDNGFKHLYEIMYELSRRCEVNRSCSVHVHLGDITFNKETIVLMYKLYSMIEKEMFDIMPPSRRIREHCQPMRKYMFSLKKRGVPYDMLIDRYYNTIFEKISLGKKASKSVNKKLNHPRGRVCGWDRSTPRYWWVNFVPALFNVKGVDNYTIEVRNMNGSLSFDDVKKWILINMAIVSFVENNKRDIITKSSISLVEIMKAEYRYKSDMLIDFIEKRKAMFMDQSRDDDHVYSREANLTKEISNLSIKKVVIG
jgi:hypothetical protein